MNRPTNICMHNPLTPRPSPRSHPQFLKDEGGPAELLRRLPVIVVEDALLHPALPLVVWLMAAQVTQGPRRCQLISNNSRLGLNGSRGCAVAGVCALWRGQRAERCLPC